MFAEHRRREVSHKVNFEVLMLLFRVEGRLRLPSPPQGADAPFGTEILNNCEVSFGNGDPL
jgi:hypothetical protein